MAGPEIPNNESAENVYKVDLKMTKDGTYWHKDRDGKVIVLDDAAEDERDRQQREPGTPPTDGYPEYSKRAEREEIPTPESEFAARKDTLKQLADSLVGTGTISRDFHSNFLNNLEDAKEDAVLEFLRGVLDREEKKSLPDIEGAVRALARIERDKAPGSGNSEAAEDQRIRSVAQEVFNLIDDNYDPQQSYDMAIGNFTDPADRKFFNSLMNEEEKRRGRRFGFIYDTYERSGGPLRGPLLSRRQAKLELQQTITNAAGGPPIDRSGRRDAGGAPPDGPSDATAALYGGESGGRRVGPPDWKYDARDYVGIKQMTTQSILSSPEHSKFFGEILRNIWPTAGEIIVRYNSRTASPEEMRLMKYATLEYCKWNQIWEKLAETLTERDVEVFARRNESLHNIVVHLGTADGLRKLRNSIRHLAMKDQVAFEQLENSVHRVHAARDSYLGKKANEKIEKLSAEIGIERKDYEDVVNLSDKKASEDDLTDRIHKRAGRVRRSLDWFNKHWGMEISGSSRAEAMRIMKEAEATAKGKVGLFNFNGRTGRMMDRTDKDLDVISSHLTDIVGDEETRAQVQEETMENKTDVPRASERAPNSLAEAKGKIDAVTDASIEEKVTALKSDPLWESGGESYQNKKMRELKEKESKAQRAGAGFWSWFFDTLFGSKFDKAASKVTGRKVEIK